MEHIHEKLEAGKANCFRKDDQGILWFNDRIVVPKDAEVRQQILDEAHLSRYSIHPRSTKMYQDLKQHYWWKKMKIEIARYVERCDTCRRVKAVHMKTARPLQSLPIPTWKWEDISMDFIVGLPKTVKGFDSVWVIIDRLTKITHFLPIKVKYTVATYAELYIARILSLHGVPKTIVSDRGPQFVSKFWEELHKSLGTKLLHNSAYHPQTSGQTERVNQILEDMLRACVLEFPQKWDDCLPLAEFSYNNSYQESIKMAPFEALYG
jgi:transposase InsO family protein